MWRWRLTELNWVSTKIRFRTEWMQFEIGMSINRYFPAIGTAGLLRDLVSGKRRVPRPPPRISEMTRGMQTSPSTLARDRDLGSGNGPRGGCRRDCTRLNRTCRTSRPRDQDDSVVPGR